MHQASPSQVSESTARGKGNFVEGALINKENNNYKAETDYDFYKMLRRTKNNIKNVLPDSCYQYNCAVLNVWC